MKEELKWYIKKNKGVKVRHSQLSYNYRYLAEIPINKDNVSEVINILTVFIK